MQKNGGNVAAYFCTPDLEVIHAIAGNVGADVFLKEAKWAVELSKKLEGLEGEERARVAKEAHAKKLEESPKCGITCTTGVTVDLSILVQADTLRCGTITTNLVYVPEVKDVAPVKIDTTESKALVTLGRIRNRDLRRAEVREVEVAISGLLLVLSNGNDSAVHEKLSKEPLPRLKDVAGYFFEKILGEKLSDKDVKVIDGGETTRCIRSRCITLKEK